MPGGREKLLKQLQVRRDDEPSAARADGRCAVRRDTARAGSDGVSVAATQVSFRSCSHLSTAAWAAACPASAGLAA